MPEPHPVVVGNLFGWREDLLDFSMEAANSEGGPSAEKRKRKQKFFEREVETLVEEMACNHELLFGKQAKYVPEVRKRKLWLEIQEKVNAVGVIPRSIDEIKKRWYDMRLRAKEKLAERLKEANKTGGGTANIDQPTPHEELIESTIQHESVSGVSAIDSSDHRVAEDDHVVDSHDGDGGQSSQEHITAPEELIFNDEQESISIVRSKRKAVAQLQPFQDSDDEPEGSTHSAHVSEQEVVHYETVNDSARKRSYSVNTTRKSRGKVTETTNVFAGLENNMLLVQEKQHKTLRSINAQLNTLNKSNINMGDGMRRMADSLDRLCVAFEKSESNRVRDSRSHKIRLQKYYSAINRLCTVTAQSNRRSIAMQRMVSECSRNVAKGLDKVSNSFELLKTCHKGASAFFEAIETEDTGSRSSSNPTPTLDTTELRSGSLVSLHTSVRRSGPGQRRSSRQGKKKKCHISYKGIACNCDQTVSDVCPVD
ncbi:uncharacterized protein LOC144762291 [Lissotriton helveticus]